ncbi:YciI-like protein [Gramella sp. GC03-9]|uniref:YciI-like protein n=1 Tax=Christiangramia oceanisediminis TaxID=2920386 RepID=A0A9X2KVT1_9FLAO|nr:YciI-like protein [Gramella oceanisediminis]MCP9198778.1 YciI-like protein [Gramella oceanisediminis]
MNYILFYDLADNYLEERGQYRAEHLGLAREAAEKGELILGGALDEPADQALLIFQTEAQATAFANNDPYVKNGLIKDWKVRKWNAVIGSKLD